MNGSRMDPEGANAPLGPPPPLHPVQAVNPASPVNGGHGHGGVTPPPLAIGAVPASGPSLHDVKVVIQWHSFCSDS